jgi:hypothetical protein
MEHRGVHAGKQVREVGLQHGDQLPPNGVAHHVQPVHSVAGGQHRAALFLHKLCVVLLLLVVVVVVVGVLRGWGYKWVPGSIGDASPVG